jgi:hypothetical protein
VQLVLGDVGVAADGRQVRVPEVSGDEASVTRLLPQPGSGGVTKRVRGDALLEPRPLGSATDDRAQDRRLEPLALEAAEDGRVRGCLARRSQPGELAGERSGERLPARLAALAAADEQRRTLAVELQVGSVDRDQLGAPQPGLDEREQDEAVALDEPVTAPSRMPGCREQAAKLVLGQPVRLLLRLRRRLELEERIR